MTESNGATGAITTSDALIERDLATFTLQTHAITLVNGDTFTCPRSTYRKEQKILFLLKDLIVPMVKLGFTGTNDIAPEQAAQLMELLLQDGPEKAADAAAILTGQDMDWVLDNLTLEQIVGLVIPFFVSKWNLTRAAVAPLIGSLALAMPSAPPTA